MTAALQALLERVEAGTLGSGDILTAEECAMIYAVFPEEIEGAGASECVSLAMDGSIDAAKSLIDATYIGEHQVTVDWGPSGCGAKLVWWPYGLSGGREIAAQGYDFDPARAMLGAVIRALIAAADTEDCQ